MAFDWGLYLNLAEELKEFRNDQAKLRTAISRAYYSAFIKCRTKSNYSSYKKGDVHEKVVIFFKNHEDSIAYTIGNNLDSLRSSRNKADYDGDFTATWQKVESEIDLAKDILENLKKFESE